MSGIKVLVVDDDADIREVIRLYLENNGISVLLAGEGSTAIQVVAEQQPNLIILDVMLPGIDGFEVCQAIRKRSDVPILFLSAKEDDMDKIVGLGIGGDDYITKPFSPAVLVAKVKAHLRRSRLLAQGNFLENEQRVNVLEFSGLSIDMDSCVVKVDDAPIALSTKEYHLLCYLATRPNHVCSVEQLFDSIWGEEALGDYRTVMVHISNLRRKIERDPIKPQYIMTVRGFGYKFIPIDR
ncbi:DNA-binding response OmpR family regulator [Pullulanibacillus pueri]|uniref:DNA-binding response regulator n=1 Tax=Pullulanibacillus pueri TaxID=1437324 RepID=A0A8J2ZUQ3_9BACL|nr:response regulator transcription factor [Pullulanibacillus pueri]MBM7680836.1 DNA-binding response OmpR family regulator [Pullulanibacillus pueri]GGH78522.1 DNA-binding response regulator [Pullulanibacillus pueri]